MKMTNPLSKLSLIIIDIELERCVPVLGTLKPQQDSMKGTVLKLGLCDAVSNTFIIWIKM